jgi:diguanylate cyclase (GGDEF)-like protein/PAS domain S-box-containing protein
LALARAAGQPVLVMAVIFQHSPLVIVAKRQSSFQSLHDLVGKKILIARQAHELRAYFKQEGLMPEKEESLPQVVNPQDLLTGKVDAVSASSTQELFALDRARFPYQVYTPRSAGIDFYGDNLFTTELTAGKHRKRTEAFRDASLLGWQYAMQHPEETAALISTQYARKLPQQFLLFQAKQMVPLLRQEQIAIGHINPGRWQHIVDIYTDLGLLDRDVKIDGLVYTGHRFQFDWKWLSVFRGIVGMALIFLAAIILYIIRINRRLAKSILDNSTTAAALADREKLWRTIINTSPDGIAIAALDGVIIQVSSRVATMFGYESASDIVGRNIFDFFDPAWHTRANLMIGELINGSSTGAVEFLVNRQDGTTFFIEINAEILRDDNGNPRALFFIERDITERKDAEKLLDEYNQKLEALSITDGLTSLANRRRFDEILRHEYSRHARSDATLSLILLDIDFFKPFNDTYGHVKGDDCLRAVAGVIAGCTNRTMDLAARYGGEEFVCILPETDLNGAIAIAENIRQSIQALAIPHKGSKVAEVVTASLGVTTVRFLAHQSVDDILSQVDTLLYQAKSSGRNRVAFDREPATL